jgi:signal transduction histidine kinase/large-conductance mechanosensitive channel
MHHHFLAYLFIILIPLLGFSNSSWNQAKRTRTATINLNWYTSTPFIYEDGQGNLTGVEYEMMKLFKEFIMNNHQVDLKLNWVKAKDFGDILNKGKDSLIVNSFGVSALSITEQRLKHFSFTDSYLPDITVLVSSRGTPIVSSYDQIHGMLGSMEAITVKSTKYEDFLNNIKRQLNVDFNITFIGSEQNILEEINRSENKFGFIDLPVYLMLIERGGVVTRQNFFTVKGKGYGFIAPKNSDWIEPINEFLKEKDEEISEIISSYLGEELHRFIQNLYSGDELGTSILIKEKELQNALIKNANLSLEKNAIVNRVLTIGIGATSILLLVIGFLFYKNKKKTALLFGQKEQIEAHEHDIQLKNDQLLNRNSQLVSLNEEKNNLVRILAHDLRSPLSQIIGFSDILEETKSKVTKDEKFMLDQVGKSARHINEMVIKILDIDGLEESHLRVIRERLDVREILNDISSRYAPQAKAKGIEIRLIKSDKYHTIWTDHLLLMLLLENLVSNAVKFSPKNTIITLETLCEYDHVVFKISDQGPGFTDEDKTKIFNRFQRLSAKPTGSETSTGLGLSIVKKYVNDLKGEIWLESEVGKGSTFFVKLSV